MFLVSVVIFYQKTCVSIVLW